MNQAAYLVVFPRESKCVVCSASLTNAQTGIPMYEDEVLPNDWLGEWASYDACSDCYALQQGLSSSVSKTQLWKDKVR